ncbi:MAG: c-type cytochrome [Terracidiphilus sp.]|jgi:glucose dehydrogenase
MNRAGRKHFLGSVGLCLACSVAAGQNTGWTVYNGGPDGDHYSPLTQINRGNVNGLKVAWSFDTGEKGVLEDNPLIVGRVLYAYTQSQKVIALDAATGKLKWKFDSEIIARQPSRGVAYWTDGKQRLIFAAVLHFLYCLDADTGRPVASFGEGGRVDLRKDLGREYELQSIAMTSPGIIYKDLIIVGGRNPESHPAPPGDIRAYDIHTGKLRWSFHTIPHPGEAGYETWPDGAWKNAGAANNWGGMALDEERGIVYAPTGSAVSDFYGHDRIGDDLYADTLLALDAETGKRLWHFQGVHHDLWDRDFPAAPVLFPLKRNGKTVDALAQTTKQGYLFVFDRVNGKPLFPIHEREFPPSTVPGEVASPTQPVPDAPEPFARQRLTEEMLTNRTLEVHEWAVKQFRGFRSEGQFVPLGTDRPTVVFPGFDGGAEWGGPAVDPVNDVLYVNASEMAATGMVALESEIGTPGERVYKSQCAMCHGSNRAGSPPAYPSLVDVLSRLSVQQVTDDVRKGNGRMPSFPNIDEPRMKELIDFLRTSPPHEERPNPIAGLDDPGAQRVATADQRGAAVYQDHCAICHGDHMEGNPPAIPILTGLGKRFTATQTLDLLQKGRGAMPPMSDVQEPELEALLHYLGVETQAPATESKPLEYFLTGYNKFLDPDGYPAIALPWGTLNAIDLKTGKYLWKIPLGEYPELARQGMKNTGSESYGGPIVTAGGVVFIGATVYDRKFRAFDSRTGKLLWEKEMPNSGVATPATYMIDGRQYVVIAASGGRDPKSTPGGAYIAFALPH